MTAATTAKKALFTTASIALGLYAQIHKTHITGPIFDPILTACSATHHESMSDFVRSTGYRPYEPSAGMGIFQPIVCVVTQFLYRLRQIYPEGYLAWASAVVGVFPVSLLMTVEGGRADAAGPIRYPVCFGVVHQLLGMSVSVPLLWVPAYLWGGGEGPVNSARMHLGVLMALPAVILSVVVFSVDTDGYPWRVSAGILGGPALAVVSGFAVWFDVPPEKESRAAWTRHVRATKRTYRFVTLVSAACWIAILRLTYVSYGFDPTGAWRAMFAEAEAGVAFLAMDYVLIYVGVIFGYLACRDWSTAMWSLVALPVLGPAAVAMAAERLELMASEKKMLAEAKVA